MIEHHAQVLLVIGSLLTVALLGLAAMAVRRARAARANAQAELHEANAHFEERVRARTEQLDEAITPV